MNLLNKLKDARYFQIAFLGFFLLVVLNVNDWDQKYVLQCLITISSCLATQFLWIYFTTKNYNSLLSALITSLGLSLLFKTDQIYWAILAGIVAISSKFTIKYRKKHLYNPANIGVILTILITNHAWVSPGQWGSSIIILFVIGALGFFVINRVNRIDIALAFIITYGGLLFYRSIIYLGWPLDFFQHQITNGTLMLFTFFMITDPMTTPNHRLPRVIFAIILATIAYYLNTYQHFYTAPIWVLFFMTPLTVLFDLIWKNKKYEW